MVSIPSSKSRGSFKIVKEVGGQLHIYYLYCKLS